MGKFLFLFINLFVALWVFYDSQKRGYTVGRGLLWAIGVFFLLVVFLPLYLLARRKRERLLSESGKFPLSPSTKNCFYCGQQYEGDPELCPHCGQNLKAV